MTGPIAGDRPNLATVWLAGRLLSGERRSGRDDRSAPGMARAPGLRPQSDPPAGSARLKLASRQAEPTARCPWRPAARKAAAPAHHHPPPASALPAPPAGPRPPAAASVGDPP